MEYKLMSGDCREWLKNIPSESVDLLLTDCPYRIVQGGCTNKKANVGIFCKDQAASGKFFAENDIEFSEWLPLVYRVMKPRTHAYIMVNGRNVAALQAAAEKAGFIFQNLLVWEKGNVTPNRYYMNACEFVLMLRKGGAKSINNRGDSTILKAKNPVGKKLHPTEKPVELMQRIIENSSEIGETVLDPFMGSGSTGVACVNTGRKFIGIELDEHYFEMAKNRIYGKRKGGDE